MPTDKYHELKIIIIAVSIILMALTSLLIFILLFYQRKRFAHKTKLAAMGKLYDEELLKAKLETQEHTLQYLSREIHDNVGQILSLAKVQLNIMEEGNELNRPLLVDLKDSVGKAMLDLRDIAKSLNTDRIKLSSLSEITQHELQRIGRLGIIKTFFSATGKEQNIGEQKKLIVFRMIQESLQNILKHAKAKTIEVFFTYDVQTFQCQIKDDGMGFDPNLVNSKDGLGLQNMMSRAALIGGQSTIDTAVNKGTTITIILPYE